MRGPRCEGPAKREALRECPSGGSVLSGAFPLERLLVRKVAGPRRAPLVQAIRRAEDTLRISSPVTVRARLGNTSTLQLNRSTEEERNA